MTMPAAGELAPDFELHDQDGKVHRLSDYHGKPLIIYFYPKDDTPGCTKEACAFRDALSHYQKIDAQVLGVSPDTSASHKKFAVKYELPFTLLADTERAMSEAYGVWQEKNMYGKKSMGIVRSTFLIDAEGKIRKVFARVKVDGHSEQVLKALGELSQA